MPVRNRSGFSGIFITVLVGSAVLALGTWYLVTSFNRSAERSVEIATQPPSKAKPLQIPQTTPSSTPSRVPVRLRLSVPPGIPVPISIPTSTSTATSTPPRVPVSPTPVPPPAVKEPRVVTRITHYSISGSTEQELRDQMDQKGPGDHFGNRNDALTTSYISWKYTYVKREGICSIGSLDVTTDVAITLPKWESATTSGSLGAKWATYEKNLLAHENGHKNLAVQAGQDIKNALSKFSVYSDCPQLDVAAERTGQSILDAFRKKEKEYDEATNNGRTQGALFP